MSPALDLGGTVRDMDVATTLQRARAVFGAVGITRLADVTGLDSIGIPVAVCVRPNARHLTVSQGKGVTRELALASAAMEAIELYHAERATPACTRATWPALGPGAARPSWFEGGVRRRPDVDLAELDWVEGRDAATGTGVLVPHALVDLDSTRAHPDNGAFHVSSNGLASGNTPTEAVLHGLYEVVERHDDLRFRTMAPEDRQGRKLDLATVGHPLLQGLLDRLTAEASTEVEVWETTTVAGVASFRCVLHDRERWRALGAFVGTGCHRRPVVALARALTEAAQTRLTLIAGSRDDVHPGYYGRGARADGAAGAAPGLLRFHDTAPAPGRLRDDLDDVLARLSRAGFARVLVVDLTRAPVGIPVVKVLVPGMRMATAAP